MITTAIDNSIKLMTDRGWDKIYYFIDLHSTVIKPNYERGNIPTEFYPYAKEVLQYLSKREDISLIMYTCSHPEEIVDYVEFFKGHNIVFEYINENPEVTTKVGGYGCYDTKPYMNVLMDDKAGFEPETEWLEIMEYFGLVDSVKLKKFVVNTTSESGDHYTYFIQSKEEPTYKRLEKYLLEHGSDVYDGHCYEGIDEVYEITEYDTI